MIKLLLLAFCIHAGYGYPKGAPSSVCSSMTPQHDVAPAQCAAKYTIQAEKTEYQPNEAIRITVRGATKDDHFRGILLTAKNQKNQQIVGTWSVRDPTIKTLACDERENTAVTHVSPDHKQQIEALWHSPSIRLEGDTIIKATIVKSFDEIYVACFNVTLTPKQSDLGAVGSVGISMERNQFSRANTNVTWTYNNDIVTVTMISGQVGTGEYRSIGFSDDREMGNEYIFICQVSSGGASRLRRMHTKLGKRPPTASNEPVTVISMAYDNGQSTCQFSFPTNSAQAENETAPIIIRKDYYLIFAAGILRTEEAVSRHNFTFVSAKTYQLQNVETIDLDAPTTTTSNPGTSTGVSSGSPATTTTAAPTADVSVNVAWTYTAGVTSVSMKVNNLKTSQWLALGLSLDDQMGEDHVFICQHSADGTVALQRFVNPGGHSRPVLASTLANPGGTFSVSREKLENGVIFCDFTLSNFANVRRQPRQNNVPTLSQTATYKPLIAIGNINPSNVLIRHSQTSREALSQDVALNRAETIVYNADSSKSDSTGLMKAHGIIMIFTWIVLVSTGILVARYFKRSWADRKICGKAVWFAIHRTVMTCAAILTLIAFVLILVYKKGQWVSQTSQREFAHSIVGILVISFAIIQPFMALFRCNPDDQYRFIFNYAHAAVGISAFIMSVVTIFLAMFFEQFGFEVNNEWAIVVAWSCWLPVIFVLFETTEMYFRKTELQAEKVDAFNMNDRNGNGVAKIETQSARSDALKDRMKALLLLLHFVVAFALSLALMILIGRA